MAWIQKGNRRYYYRSRREGDRVISEYIGTGLFAELQAEQDQVERLERQTRMRKQKKLRQEFKQAERAVDQACNFVNQIVHAAFLVTGHHTHKRQWRKRRDD